MCYYYTITPFPNKNIWWMRVESNYHLTPYEGGALPLCYSSIGVSYENRTHDSGITTRGFATKLTPPYRNTPSSQTPTFHGRTNLLGTDVFLYGRGVR